MSAPISKKLRFEVFKRDSFTCQYCGQRAPDVVLNCDHIEPVAAGGTSDILNLITSCFDCNSGKGARKLSEQAVLAKQLDQLEELQERREQIDMLLEWRRGLSELDDHVVASLEEHWTKIVEGQTELTPTGRDRLRKCIKKFGVDLTLRAMQEASISYLRRGEEHRFTKESIDRAFASIGAVANVLKSSADKPYLKQLYYIRGILRNRFAYVAEHEVIRLMTRAMEAGASLDSLTDLSKTTRNWTQFKSAILEYLEQHEDRE